MDPKTRLEPDTLPEQIVEDDDGNMHVIDAEYLIDDARTGQNPLRVNPLGDANMDNDMPCADLMDNR